MTTQRCYELSHNGFVTAYIRRIARRYFSNSEDAEDAEAEAWARISEETDKATDVECMTVARKAIAAYYMRIWRSRKQLSRRKP